MADLYVGGKLKLKGVKDGKVKKKKKRNKLDEDKIRSAEDTSQAGEISQPTKVECNKTAAELAFQKVQEKRDAERILRKAQTSHKERVNKFNNQLDEQLEHFDIPKVSWTK